MIQEPPFFTSSGTLTWVGWGSTSSSSQPSLGLPGACRTTATTGHRGPDRRPGPQRQAERAKMTSEETYEVVDWWRNADGTMQARVRYASGLEVVRGLKSVSLEGQVTRADGTVEPAQLLSKTTNNPITNQRLREEGVGEVRP